MAKFIYKMQNILEIKYKLEEQAKTAYAVARAELNAEELKMKHLSERKEKYQNDLRNLMSELLNILDIKTCENAIETLKYKITLQKIVLQQAEKKLELARVSLNEAMIERKTHEKLRENAFEEFKKEIDMQERKEVDELVSFRYNKTTGSEEED